MTTAPHFEPGAAPASDRYAAAVLPVGPSVIRTAADGLLAGVVQIEINGVSLPAYRAVPAAPLPAGGSWPVVIVISEIFGVHAHIADVARRFAQLGYLAIAPELFVRQGDAGAYTDIPRLMDEVVRQVPDAQVAADLDAVVAWAATQGGDLDRLGVTGFCWGGRQTWLYAAHNPAVRVGVAWYGRLEGPTGPLQPHHPVDIAAELKAPVLALYGAADEGIPLASVERMQAALKLGNAHARDSEFVIYPDAPHAFHADYRPGYRAAPAQDGWARCLAALRGHGVV